MRQRSSIKSILKLIVVFVALLYGMTAHSFAKDGGKKADNKITIITDSKARVLNKANGIQLFSNNRKINKDEIKFGAVASSENYYGIYTTQRQIDFNRGGKFCVNKNLHTSNEANVQMLICDNH